MIKKHTQIDRKKIYQILSVYVLALVAAVIFGSGMGAKSTTVAHKQEVGISK